MFLCSADRPSLLRVVPRCSFWYSGFSSFISSRFTVVFRGGRKSGPGSVIRSSTSVHVCSRRRCLSCCPWSRRNNSVPIDNKLFILIETVDTILPPEKL